MEPPSTSDGVSILDLEEDPWFVTRDGFVEQSLGIQWNSVDGWGIRPPTSTAVHHTCCVLGYSTAGHADEHRRMFYYETKY
jgi:hypothetical protein